MANQVRNTLIAGTVASLFLGPLGALAVGAVASQMSKDEEATELTIKEFSIWNDDQLIGVVEVDRIQNVLNTMNNQKSIDLSGIRVGVRLSNDSAQYYTLEEATALFN